eukprot:4928677-Alexandrium_andersonii.AAC.1
MCRTSAAGPADPSSPSARSTHPLPTEATSDGGGQSARRATPGLSGPSARQERPARRLPQQQQLRGKAVRWAVLRGPAGPWTPPPITLTTWAAAKEE